MKWLDLSFLEDSQWPYSSFIYGTNNFFQNMMEQFIGIYGTRHWTHKTCHGSVFKHNTRSRQRAAALFKLPFENFLPFNFLSDSSKHHLHWWSLTNRAGERLQKLVSFGIMGDWMKGLLKPLDNILCCDGCLWLGTHYDGCRETSVSQTDVSLL